MTARIRLHRRAWWHDGREYQVMSLRPGDPTRYSVQRWRDTLIIYSDLAGARLLGRLLWGLSYQRRPNTVLVLNPGHLAPDPFDGAPSPTLVFGATPGTALSTATTRALRRPVLWRSRPDGTAGWNTAGLVRAYDERDAWQRARRAGVPVAWAYRPDRPPPNLLDAGGACAVLAAPELLRDWAVTIADAGAYWYHGESCTEPHFGPGGIDVHAVRHFHRQVSAAARARAEVLAAPDCPADPAEVSRRVMAHTAAVAARRPGPWEPAPPVGVSPVPPAGPPAAAG